MREVYLFAECCSSPGESRFQIFTSKVKAFEKMEATKREDISSLEIDVYDEEQYREFSTGYEFDTGDGWWHCEVKTLTLPELRGVNTEA